MSKSIIKISAISYLNTLPFVYGIRESGFLSDYEMSLDTPAQCAEKVLSGVADVGLVPSVILAEHKECIRVNDFCIGTKTGAASVFLFSQVPLKKIKVILMDYQSQTSVALTKILTKFFWNIQPLWNDTKPGFEKKIAGTTAGIVIGDRAMKMKHLFPVALDISAEWIKFTGLPFVFACWVSRKKMPVKFVTNFNRALKFGTEHIETAILKYPPDSFSAKESLKYLSHNIVYTLDKKLKKGLEVFYTYYRLTKHI